MKLLTLLLVVGAASAYDVKFKSCPNVDSSKCTINAIRIEPCKSQTSCEVILGSDAVISFDFTPNFSTDALETMVSFHTPTGISVPWDDMDPDGCKLTSCPTTAGTMQTYNKTVHIGKQLHKGRFPVLWKVKDKKDETNMCCFRVTIKIPKK